MTDPIKLSSFSVFCFYLVTRVKPYRFFKSRWETDVRIEISSEPRAVAGDLMELQHEDHGLALPLHHLEGYMQRRGQANKGMYKHV